MSKVSDYPLLWQEGVIQKLIREQANHRCEWCGIEFSEGTNFAISAKNKRGKPIIGTVHHINEVKEDLRWSNLVFLCQTCHCRVQWTWRPGQIIPLSFGEVPNWILIRGLPYVSNPQLTFPF